MPVPKVYYGEVCMEWSAFGQRFCGKSGIVELMQDLGEALQSRPDMVFMGGGNPGRVPGVEAIYRSRLQAILGDERRAHEVLGIYQMPQGDVAFREALANTLAGRFADGRHKHIQLPLVPEYIGYREIGLSEGLFHAQRPAIELLPDKLFKYRVDFVRLSLDASAGAICVSRPTNPTGNVLSDEEVRQLDALARRQGIPLIIDGAYGTPFPQMIFSDATPKSSRPSPAPTPYSAWPVAAPVQRWQRICCATARCCA